jgi:quercetin dioxygenase-like cupin family protein
VEEIVYVLAGRGSTTIQQQGHRRDAVQWQEGSLFTPPLNVTYEYANTSSAKPARLLVFSAFPLVTQIAGNASYVNNVNHTFKERYDAEEDFFRKSERGGDRLWKTNFIKDVREFKLDKWDFRGAGNSSMFWQMADNRLLSAHVSTFPSGTYKKAHRHPNEALIYILKGKGYSLIWHKKGEKPTRVAWHEGSLIVAPYFWYHQHFNTGDTPASYLAITPGKLMGVLLHTTIDEDTGGGGDPANQIEYADEDPEIRATFEREVGRKVILK